MLGEAFEQMRGAENFASELLRHHNAPSTGVMLDKIKSSVANRGLKRFKKTVVLGSVPS